MQLKQKLEELQVKQLDIELAHFLQIVLVNKYSSVLH